MKRVVAGLVAMALITSYSVPVFAETNVGEHVTEVETKTTPVKSASSKGQSPSATHHPLPHHSIKRL